VVSVPPLPAYEKLTYLLKPRHKALALSDSVSEKNSSRKLAEQAHLHTLRYCSAQLGSDVAL
jgi:hypothetical protein